MAAAHQVFLGAMQETVMGGVAMVGLVGEGVETGSMMAAHMFALAAGDDRSADHFYAIASARMGQHQESGSAVVDAVSSGAKVMGGALQGNLDDMDVIARGITNYGDKLASGDFRTVVSTVTVAVDVGTMVVGAGLAARGTRIAAEAAEGAVETAVRHTDDVAEAVAHGADDVPSGVCRGPGCGGPGTCFVAGTLVMLATNLAAAQPIETLHVGDRVATVDGGSDTEVDATWAVVELELPNPYAPDDILTVVLLRPIAWLEEQGALDVGAEVYLDLEELSVHGVARVTSIRGPPEVAPGPGRVVLSTVTHVSNNVHELQLAGYAEPVRPTGEHRFYSLDRDDWVATQDLEVGEWLQTEHGAIEVVSVRRLPDPQRVYNIEVESEHEFLVTAVRLRTHNVEPCPPAPDGSRPTPRQSEVDVNGLNPDHRPQVSFRNGEEVGYGSPGSVRPDNFRMGEALEVKNYDLLDSGSRSNLYNTLHRQYLQRLSNLPRGTHQRIIIDVRGQSVPDSILRRVRRNILTITRTPNVTVEFLR